MNCFFLCVCVQIYTDSVLIINDDVPPDDDYVPSDDDEDADVIDICSLLTISGKSFIVHSGNIHYFPIIQSMTDMSTDNDAECESVEIPFYLQTVLNYVQFCSNANLFNFDAIAWTQIIKMYEFALFTENDEFIRYFVIKIIPRVLNESNVFRVRRMLSFSNCPSYLQCSYNEDDWDYDPFHNHSYEHDCILSTIPMDLFIGMYSILTARKQCLLFEAMKKNCAARNAIVAFDNEFPQRVYQHYFNLSDQNDRFKIFY